LEDNTKITLIDYEYGGWNPMAMDIANYLNECCLENAHPKGVGIKVYLENFPNQYECNQLMKAYLKCYYEKKAPGEDYDSFEKKNLPRFRREVEACLLLNNYYWGVWALAVLRDKDVCDDKVFNYEFAISRIKMYKMQVKLFQELKATEASSPAI
jgi:thiamine kinase-like enzyme